LRIPKQRLPVMTNVEWAADVARRVVLLTNSQGEASPCEDDQSKVSEEEGSASISCWPAPPRRLGEPRVRVAENPLAILSGNVPPRATGMRRQGRVSHPRVSTPTTISSHFEPQLLLGAHQGTCRRRSGSSR
jgi:hypothetical protein